MQYREVKKNGDKLSVLGFGGMRFPTIKGKINEPRSKALLKQAIDSGINYIDTSYVYHNGKSESFIGDALTGGYRQKVKLATKLPVRFVRTRQDMDRFLDIQLSNLKTDHIDYYLLHALNGKYWKNIKELGVFDFIDSALKSGKILNIGFSFHGLKEEFKKIIDEYDKWIFCQVQYNYLDVNYQAGIEGINQAYEKDISVFVMEPLRGGLLAKNFPSAIQNVLKEKDFNRSAAYLALRWVLDNPKVTMVLSGMNSERDIVENIETSKISIPRTMPQNELFLVSDLEKSFRNYFKTPCTGCGYCMPCPYGVNIPTCFEVYNGYNGKNRIDVISKYIARLYNVSDGTRSSAFECKNCGLCEEKCPQGIEIRKHLKDIKTLFEPLYVRILAKTALFFVKCKILFDSKFDSRKK